MSSFKKTPASIRSIKAWLRTLGRPGFWISTTVLGLVVIFTWELLNHPEWLSSTGNDSAEQQSGQTAVDQALTPEDAAAIGADIDNLPALMQEFTRGSRNNSKQKSANTQPEGFYDQVLRQQAEAAKAASMNPQTSTSQLIGLPSQGNRFAPSTTQNLLNIGSASNNNPFSNSSSLLGMNGNRDSNASQATDIASPVVGIGSFNSGNQNSAVAPVSPLQTAITPQNSAPLPIQAQQPVSVPGQAASTSTPPTFNNTAVQPPTTGYSNTTIQPPTSGDSSNTSYNAPATNPSNPYSYSVPQAVPVIPPVPQAAPVVPVTPGSYGQYPTQAPQAGYNTIPGATSTLNNSAMQPSQLNQSPFSVPNRVPGRTIGGGKINSFSNP